MRQDAEPDVDAAVGWLRAWHGRSGPWVIFEIDPDLENAPVPARSFADVDKLRAYLADRIGKVNLYFAANRCDPFVRTTPRRDQVTGLLCVFADLDLPKSGPYSQPTEENFAILRRRVEALDPAPTALLFSGGGYQAMWRFAAAVEEVASYSERAERVGKAIADALGSDAVQNINRLLRLPGTINVPNAKKRERGRIPALAAVVSADWSRTWSFDDPTPNLPPGFSSGEQPTSGDAPRSFGDLPLKWQKLARSGDAANYRGDRSRLVFAFVAALVRRGWRDEDVIPYLCEEAYGISAHCRSQPNPKLAAKRQVERVRAAVARDWDRTTQGAISPVSPRNIRRAIFELGFEFEYDEFADKINYVNGQTLPKKDYVDSMIRTDVYDKFGFRPHSEAMFDTIVSSAMEKRRHPVREYLAAVQPTWDGVDRVQWWLCHAAGVEPSEYARVTSRLMCLAAVRRVRRPGCKFDQMMVLISQTQGFSKGKALRTLVPVESWYSDSLSLRATEKETIEQLSGKWIVECAELKGIRLSEVESLKQFLSRQEDRARLVWDRHRTDAARQCVFFGTTNSIVFLQDRENRRFWPHVVNRMIDVAWIMANRDQLWAEAATLEAADPSDALIEFPERLWPVAAAYQEEARLDEPWADILAEALQDVTGRISNQDVWKVLGKPPHMRLPGESARIVEAMREIGWDRSPGAFRVGGIVTRGFVRRGASPEDARQFVYVLRDPLTGDVTVSNAPPPDGAYPKGDAPF